MPKLKIEEAGSLLKYERQKLLRLYTQGAAAYGSVRNLAKTSRLPVSKVRQFLHSKASFTKNTLATRKFKKMRAFPTFRNENWCMDLAYVDKLAKQNDGKKFLLVRQKIAKKLWKRFHSWRNDRKKFGLTRGPNLLERSKRFVLQRSYKFTLLWVRLRQFLLNVQNDCWKNFFIVTCRILHTSIYTNYLNLSLP